MTVSLDVDGGVGVLTLDRPDVLNSFNDEMGHAALDAVRTATRDDQVRCLVVTGAGRGFSAGEDLAALASDYERGQAPELGQTLVDRYNPLIRALRATPKPVLAAINGVAAGAGVSVALACDFRIASSHAKFVLAFVNAALVPDSGALWFLSRMIGTARTWELATSGRPVGAEEALALGLVDEVIDPDDFEARWRARAAELAAGPTRAYALIKALMNRAADRSLDDELDAEVDAQTAAGKTSDHMEGVTAFLAKRKPNFKGY